MKCESENTQREREKENDRISMREYNKGNDNDDNKKR